MAWYGPEHAERIAEIRSLQRKGLTLAAIRRVVSGELGPADADLAAAVSAARGETGDGTRIGTAGADGAGGTTDDDPGALLTLDEFAARSGVPASLIQAVEREGIRLGRSGQDGARYTSADIDLVGPRSGCSSSGSRCRTC